MIEYKDLIFQNSVGEVIPNPCPTWEVGRKEGLTSKLSILVPARASLPLYFSM